MFTVNRLEKIYRELISYALFINKEQGFGFVYSGKEGYKNCVDIESIG